MILCLERGILSQNYIHVVILRAFSTWPDFLVHVYAFPFTAEWKWITVMCWDQQFSKPFLVSGLISNLQNPEEIFGYQYLLLYLSISTVLEIKTENFKKTHRIHLISCPSGDIITPRVGSEKLRSTCVRKEE